MSGQDTTAMIARAVEDVLANEVQFMSARLADNGDEQVRVSSGDERPARGMPPDVAVNGGRGGTAVADRDGADPEDVPC